MKKDNILASEQMNKNAVVLSEKLLKILEKEFSPETKKETGGMARKLIELEFNRDGKFRKLAMYYYKTESEGNK